MRDRAVAREPELHPPRTHAVPDWMLRDLFLMLDLRLKYAADRGGVRHVVWARHFSHHFARIPVFSAGTGLARHFGPATNRGGGGAGE